VFVRVCVCEKERERERDVYFKRESEGDEIGGKLEQIGRPGGRRLGGVKCRTEVDTTRHTYKSWAQELRISRIDNVARAAGVLWIWNGSAGSLKPGLLLEVGRSGRSQSSSFCCPFMSRHVMVVGVDTVRWLCCKGRFGRSASLGIT
jgi:hypothetical protein